MRKVNRIIHKGHAVLYEVEFEDYHTDKVSLEFRGISGAIWYRSTIFISRCTSGGYDPAASLPEVDAPMIGSAFFTIVILCFTLFNRTIFEEHVQQYTLLLHVRFPSDLYSIEGLQSYSSLSLV